MYISEINPKPPQMCFCFIIPLCKISTEKNILCFTPFSARAQQVSGAWESYMHTLVIRNTYPEGPTPSSLVHQQFYQPEGGGSKKRVDFSQTSFLITRVITSLISCTKEIRTNEWKYWEMNGSGHVLLGLIQRKSWVYSDTYSGF